MSVRIGNKKIGLFMGITVSTVLHLFTLRLLTHVGFFRQNGPILSEVVFYMERSKNLEKKMS